MDRRTFLRNSALLAGAGAAVPVFKLMPAKAVAASGGSLVVAIGDGPNSMDIHREGTNRPAYALAVNLYDRLVTFGRQELEDGNFAYDYNTLEPEVAESWTVADDEMSVDFKIRKDARFWDGRPITAHDVKWSFDRAVSVGGFPTTQMGAGSLEDPEQFEAVDDETFRIHFIRKSKLTLPNLAVPVPIIINSEVAREHATDDDPWATDYLHRNPAGSGAFKLHSWDPGVQVVYQRNEDWMNGPVPEVEQVVLREMPSASTRRAMVERGDIDIAMDLPPRDARDLVRAGEVNVAGVPIENCLHSVGLNLEFEPFKDKRVRQAIAYAIPYQDIWEAAAYERGVPMFGADSFEPATAEWPQPFPYDTDYDKARELLNEAGYGDGFEVPISLNLGLAHWSEPAAALIREGLRQVGIDATVEEIPGANWRTRALVEKELPMHLKNFGGWLNTPCYYFYWAYLEGNLFNSMNYHNDDVARLVDETLHMEMDHPDYEDKIKELIAIAFDEVPLIPLYQPNLEVAMQPSVSGYEHWFHRRLDARPLKQS
ncbi:ABC transporter substrate-binding protein [Aquisalimonas asiatica]|uniref:Peptide/nickel transport system substrate-binding protein n=1 Tax=Aquisalimonas asiatica TaxID=406100 RepID=A0A1H8S4F7_9GAMM|nr:ABC transporter substrate-binding protein [Aquisalimonas asiatica]SEO73581.1 peptide/nickel transport system substrate-binding protein [Aquisalimonas asiatica]